MGNARLGVTLGVTLAALAGCSDDDSPNVIPDVEAGVDAAVTGNTEGPVDTTGGSGGESSTTTTPTTSEGPDTLTVGATGTSESGTAATSSEPVDPSSAVTSEPTGVVGTSDFSVGTSASTTDVVDTSVPPSTDDTGGDGAIAPPGNMTVIANFDVAAGFQDGQHNLPAAHVRSYADSLMTVEAAFTASGQQTGVNFNYSADICGYDIVARIRLRSGTIAAGGVQMRVWSDSWNQFASQSGAIGAVGEWNEYRITWSDVVSENDDLNINAINAVGFAFMTFGAADASVFDVDWIGLVPSDTPCPSVDTGDTGSTTTTPDVDSGVVDPGDGGTVEPLPNLVANGGFEVDTAGWYSWGSGVTLTASTDKAHTGEQSLLASGGAGIGPIATQINNPVPGGTYEVSLWASTGSGDASVRLVRSLACDDVQYLWVVGNTTITDDAWTEFTGTFTVPEDCDSASFQVYLEGATADADVYVDDVWVTLISGGDGEETTEPGATTAPEVSTSEPEVTTSEPVVTSDGDAGVIETDASVDNSTSDDVISGGEPDASVSDVFSSEPVDTSVAPETSAPADTTVVDETSAPGNGGEAIPGDLEVVTEFNSTVGYVGTFATTDSFESITPVVADGVAQFTVPFDLAADRFQWVINTTPSPRDLTGATLAARVRVVGLTNDAGHPSVLQLYGNNGAPNYGGTASFNALATDGSWQVIEYSLDTPGYGSYTPAAVTSVAFEFRPNPYDGTTDAHVVSAVIEVDWVGLRLAD